ncbi:hypothetical protein [Enterococcus cecorum]|uniref:hypothetical protein n=1 Tax=Enterococcus cecorum TaxID=44008 RepID=UPI002ACAB80E|nr:hypothetical protein [Enterococcus cecorum]MDZ5589941.1 hypothetical protein [Enterococcus cecorum]
MKMIDVLNMMAKGEIKEGTKLITDDDLDDYVYQYSELYQAFMDRYMNRVEDDFEIDKDFLNLEVKLIPPKEKKYLVKFNMRGINERESYLKFYTSLNVVSLNVATQTRYAKSHFTKEEMQSIKPVREFLEDMEGKYELIEVEE